MTPALFLAAVATTLPAGAAPADARSVAPAERAPGLAGITVTIDPGHNGENYLHPDEINRQVSIGKGETKECDTVGTETDSAYPESRFNFSVAKKLRRLLRDHGAKVVFTRKNDRGWGPCINRRAKIGNKAHSDAAVSIHADGGPPGGRGFHVIRPTRIEGLTDDIYRPSRRLARALRDRYRAETGLPTANYIGRNGIDARGDLGGLRLSNVPKVFIETGNMRNAADARKLESRSFRVRIAFGIFRGLARFLKHEPPEAAVPQGS